MDRALRAMRHRGARAGCVNAGGDLAAFGDTVLPVMRRERDGSCSALGGLSNGAMASSRRGAPPPALAAMTRSFCQHRASSLSTVLSLTI
ncbi:FAD:protein FMN transferase [Massilia genomosp. 1]|uniref:Glutamine amidotransferase type-2 domain-containing protein n=1 Tax=Massilia genomosp. 1 TaxID=2609280 RepID=A0ABX0N5E5_9BURK|nr:hypothetical protein [Massilia genomosp. 1]